MKTPMSLALAALFLVSGSASANPAPGGQDGDTLFVQLNEIAVGFASYMNEETTELPARQVGKVLARFIPCPAHEEMINCSISHYNDFLCGYSNCDRPSYDTPDESDATTEVSIDVYPENSDVRKCAEALTPAGICDFHVACIPDALEAYSKGLSPTTTMTEWMSECVTRQMMENMGLTYQADVFTDNYGLIMEKLLEGNVDLPESVKQKLRDVGTGNVCRLPGKDSCLLDILKFKMCMMNICMISLNEINA